jgi:hypothetical protein
MLSIIEKVKDLFKCKAKKKTEFELQQEKKSGDNTKEKTACSEEDSSN